MKARRKAYIKRKPYCRKKGGAPFNFSSEPSSWGFGSATRETEESIKERLARTFTNIFRPAPDKLIKQRLIRAQLPANKVHPKEIQNDTQQKNS